MPCILEGGPCVQEGCVVVACIAARAIIVRRGSIELVIVPVLHTQARVGPWVDGWSAPVPWRVAEIDYSASRVG